jgi:hypothetical protein
MPQAKIDERVDGVNEDTDGKHDIVDGSKLKSLVTRLLISLASNS